ncbi:MAG: acyltransferase [Cocleimonas sp.]|nr:acyltransferase [Cocleimonas sp.]
MTYRKEIDGLRALAVVSVILFHAGFKWIGGGYIGVDMFFVISGYLITSLLLKDLEHGVFSIKTFYEKRARRILPALFFILLLCLPFAWVWFLPNELKDFGKSLIAVVAFVSNIFFLQETDYFTSNAELIPLLHTWSLAVEEQFYLVFPLLLALFWRGGQAVLFTLMGVIALLSLGLTEWGWRYYPNANFYLILTRAWELMMGALLANYLFYHQSPKGWICHWASLFGLVLIVGSFFFLDKSIPFPSVYTLIPTLGTLLVILFANQDTLVNKLLSLKLLVGIGLISYSAYLWHQPLFIFARAASIDTPSLTLMGFLSVATFPLAYLSWRYIESPFRNRQHFTQKQIFMFTFGCSLLFIVVGLFLILSDGAMYRFS